MTGPELKQHRIRYGVRAADLAERMGLGRTRVPQIEATAAVSRALSERYLDALIALSAERRLG